MSGMSDKIGGKTKQAVGSATDNKDLQVKGKAQETKGKVKDSIKSVGDSTSDKVR
jgi:uncharacterized protein YjbJ (UPF0337 family)